MSDDNSNRLSRFLALTCVAVLWGCASMAVVADREGDRSASNVLRLAAEQGITDQSNEEWRLLRIPFEVRTDSLGIVLPGCSIRPFRIPSLDDSEFSLDSITEEPAIQVKAAQGRPRELSWSPGLVLTPSGLVRTDTIHLDLTPPPGAVGGGGFRPPQVTGRLVIPPHSVAMVEVTAGIRRSDLGDDDLGLRLDSSPQALSAPSPCPGLISDTDSLYVEHFVLPGVMVESFSLALVSTALFLGVIILVVGL